MFQIYSLVRLSILNPGTACLLPTNLVSEKISSEQLKTPLSRTPPPNDHEVEGLVLEEILKLVRNANDEVIMIVDACAIRHDVREEVNELAKKTGFPVYAAPMGKTTVSESYERYGGVSCSFLRPWTEVIEGALDLYGIRQPARSQGQG
jgi:TPP-dependent 2-oxoacid decarboxylase